MSSAPQNYQAAKDFLFKQLPMFSTQGAQALNPSLDKIRQLCTAMQYPEQRFKSIHIAGTNGKGSTSHIMAAAMQTAGYKTGLYTSPHLIDLRERIRINGTIIEEQKVIDFLNQFWKTIQEVQPSYFELNVAMAFWIFAQEKVDIAVIETGLGGRWDSTNVIIPELSIITNISLDHTNILGDTLAAIAGEKAGIIKDKKPVVIGKSQPETEAVFSQQALLHKTTLTYADVLFEGAIVAKGSDYQELKIVDRRDYTIHHISTDLMGAFQVDNIKTAMAGVATLNRNGWKVDLDHFKLALQNVKTLTGLRGRWEKIKDKPLIICDVGHNPAGMEVVMSQLNHADYLHLNKKIITGFVADKDVAEALSMMPKNAYFYLTQAKVPRALPVAELESIAKQLNLKTSAYPSIEKALAAAIHEATEQDMILITGSFFIVGEALAYLEN
jgi:dihydrofolate synthase/folylpolyglutamate synthase